MQVIIIMHLVLNLIPYFLVLAVAVSSLFIFKKEINSYVKRLIVGASMLLTTILFTSIFTNLIATFFYGSSVVVSELPDEFMYFIRVREPLEFVLSLLIIIYIVYFTYTNSPEHKKFLIFSALTALYFIVWQIFGQQILSGLEYALSSCFNDSRFYYSL